LGTLLTGGVPVFFVTRTLTDANGNTLLDPSGKPVPIWSVFWSLFGASNQLLAALTLLGVTVWLWRTRRAMWVWFVTGIPTVWMYAMSSWALVRIIRTNFANGLTADPVAWIAVVLVVLAVLMLIEAILVLSRLGTGASPPTPEPVGRLEAAT
jgi:carbon starvation protein